MSASSVSLTRHIREALTRAGVGPEHRLGIGCSGGPDSAALAHATMALRARGQVGELLLIHVDHGLRPDSAADAAVVAELAAAGDGSAVSVPVVVDRESASLERAAREARYQAFEAVAQERSLDVILLAHTASDQAETVLMRVLRGTGVFGLAGIPERRDRYLRPLLQVTRADIEAYVAEHQLVTVRDPSNRDERFFRNRVRRRWLPALQEENPQLAQALCRVAESAAQQREVQEFAADALLTRARRPTSPGGAGLHTPELAKAPPAVTRHALALAYQRARGQPLSARHQRALQDLVCADTSGTRELDLPGGRALRTYDLLSFDGGRSGTTSGTAMPGVLVEGPDGPYHVRTWQPGDRMRPERLRGRSRKLSDLFIDGRVPRELRTRALVVVRPADGAIVWAQHIGLAHGAQVRVILTDPGTGASNTPVPDR